MADEKRSSGFELIGQLSAHEMEQLKNPRWRGTNQLIDRAITTARGFADSIIEQAGKDLQQAKAAAITHHDTTALEEYSEAYLTFAETLRAQANQLYRAAKVLRWAIDTAELGIDDPVGIPERLPRHTIGSD